MQRLFSTFAHGAPGIGLLLLRFKVRAIATIHVMVFAKDSTRAFAAFHAFLAVLALLLIALWTPKVAALMAISAIVEAGG